MHGCVEIRRKPGAQNKFFARFICFLLGILQSKEKMKRKQIKNLALLLYLNFLLQALDYTIL